MRDATLLGLEIIFQGNHGLFLVVTAIILHCLIFPG